MKIAHFIVNASKKIGMGHWMRCVELAAAFKTMGVQSIFHTWETIPNTHAAIDFIAEKKYSSSKDLIAQLKESLRDTDLVIIDSDESLLTNTSTQSIFKEKSECLAYFSINSEIRFDCDYIISYNIISRSINYQHSDTTTLLTGLEYAILREEFRIPRTQRNQNSKPSAFIGFGGSDPLNATTSVLGAVIKYQERFHTIEVVLGDLSASKIPFVLPDNVNIHQQVSNISEIMSTCDIGFCGTGGTFYELSIFDIPCWIVASSSRELEAYNYLQMKNMAVGIGTVETGINLNKIEETLGEYVRTGQVYQKAFREVSSELDGQGVFRLVDRLLSRNV